MCNRCSDILKVPTTRNALNRFFFQKSFCLMKKEKNILIFALNNILFLEKHILPEYKDVVHKGYIFGDGPKLVIDGL